MKNHETGSETGFFHETGFVDLLALLNAPRTPPADDRLHGVLCFVHGICEV